MSKAKMETVMTKETVTEGYERKLMENGYMKLQGVNPPTKGIVPIFTKREKPKTIWQLRVSPDQMIPDMEITVSYICPESGVPFYCRETPEQVLELLSPGNQFSYFLFKDKVLFEPTEGEKSNVVQLKKAEEALERAVEEVKSEK